MRVDWTLKGLTAMLLHADNVEQNDDLKLWQKDPDNRNLSVAGDDRSPAWTWITYLDHDEGRLVVPTHNIMRCLCRAATKMIMKRQTTYKEISQSGITMDREFVDLLVNGNIVPMARIEPLRDVHADFERHREVARSLGFTLFVKRAKIGKGKHVRVRARIAPGWQLKGSLDVDVPEITFDVLTRMFDIAGRVGLGDWRPGGPTPGPFGMFTAELKQVKAAKVA